MTASLQKVYEKAMPAFSPLFLQCRALFSWTEAAYSAVAKPGVYLALGTKLFRERTDAVQLPAKLPLSPRRLAVQLLRHLLRGLLGTPRTAQLVPRVVRTGSLLSRTKIRPADQKSRGGPIRLELRLRSANYRSIVLSCQPNRSGQIYSERALTL